LFRWINAGLILKKSDPGRSNRVWARLKNELILRLARMGRPAAIPGPFERILIVSTTALGDTLWATPALEDLRRGLPGSRICVLTSLIGEEALRHHPAIDKLIVLQEPLLPRLHSLIRQIKKERFDAALIFHASQRLVLPLCTWSRIPRMIGTRGINKGLDDLLTHAIEPVFEHEIERRQRIVRQLNVSSGVGPVSYFVQPAERDQALQWLGHCGRPCMAVHAGSKDLFRRYPPERFIQTIQIVQSHGIHIFLSGSASEAPLMEKIRQQVPGCRVVPPSSLRFLAAIYEQMDLILSNDTGPFHLACALNRPAIGLYVPTDARLCGPYRAPRAIAISRPPTCQPCHKRRCRDPFCFLQITPEEIAHSCLQQLFP
jgi:ADP-heptose:LPS heptosyltransferase